MPKEGRPQWQESRSKIVWRKFRTCSNSCSWPLNERANLPGLQELVDWQIPIQQRHLEQTLKGSVELAADEDPNEPA